MERCHPDQETGHVGPRYIGPGRVISRVGRVGYHLELTEEISLIHNTFHIYQLQKCLVDDSTVVHLEDIQVDDRHNYNERLVSILDRKKKTLRNKVVELVKVQWLHHKGWEWTLEPEEEMKEHYLGLFEEAYFEDEV